MLVKAISLLMLPSTWILLKVSGTVRHYSACVCNQGGDEKPGAIIEKWLQCKIRKGKRVLSEYDAGNESAHIATPAS
jgi:hypothetical protein